MSQYDYIYGIAETTDQSQYDMICDMISVSWLSLLTIMATFPNSFLKTAVFLMNDCITWRDFVMHLYLRVDSACLLCTTLIMCLQCILLIIIKIL